MRLFFFFNIPMKIMNRFRDGKNTGYTNIRIIDLNEYVSMVYIYIYVNIDILICMDMTCLYLYLFVCPYIYIYKCFEYLFICVFLYLFIGMYFSMSGNSQGKH